jgi:hypothetical protein
VKELQRLLGKKTTENEILKEGVEVKWPSAGSGASAIAFRASACGLMR